MPPPVSQSGRSFPVYLPRNHSLRGHLSQCVIKVRIRAVPYLEDEVGQAVGYQCSVLAKANFLWQLDYTVLFQTSRHLHVKRSIVGALSLGNKARFGGSALVQGYGQDPGPARCRFNKSESAWRQNRSSRPHLAQIDWQGLFTEGWLDNVCWSSAPCAWCDSQSNTSRGKLALNGSGTIPFLFEAEPASSEIAESIRTNR